MKKCFSYFHYADINTCYASMSYDNPQDELWFAVCSADRTTVCAPASGELSEWVNLEACVADDVHITRAPNIGGPILVDRGSVGFFFKGSPFNRQMAMDVFIETLRSLGIEPTEYHNDILVDDKKVIGFGTFSFEGVSTVSGAGIVSTPAEVFAKYLAVPADKLSRHGEGYAMKRVGRISDYVPGLTVEKFADALRKTFAPDYERTLDSITGNESYQHALSVYRSNAWIKYGLRPEEVYKLQSVTFANGKTFEVESVQGNTLEGKEALTFIFPEQAGVDFNALASVFVNPEATRAITITYIDQTGEEAEPTRINMQLGFIKPVSLNFTDNKFHMTLSKE